MATQHNRFTAEYLRLINEYSQEFRKLSQPVADRVLELIMGGMDVNKAVAKALAESNFFGRNQDVLTGVLYKAAAYGYDVDPSKVANPAGVKRKLLYEAWAPDKMTLSTRLHGTSKEMRRDIVDTITSAMRQQKSFTGMARDLYDGYNSGQRVINKAELPEYLDRLQQAARKIMHGDRDAMREFNQALKTARRNIDKLSSGGAPTKALKAAYSQMLKAAENLSEKALDKAVRTAVEEKSRYLAERIARTETSAAWGEAFFAKHQDDPDVIAYRWVLSTRHPKVDICNVYAGANFYGLGKGVYPKDKFPKHPAHAHCMCLIEPVFEGEIHIDFDKEAEILDNAKFNSKAGDEVLKGMPEYEQKQLLGTDGWKTWKKGEDWRKHLRLWNDQEQPESRFKAEDFTKHLSQENAIIKQMREFKGIGDLPSKVFSVLDDRYGIKDNQISISNETVQKITTDHPEFKGMNIPSFVNDILKNASIIQSNQRDDTVRVVGVNRNLSNPVPSMAEEKFFYLIIRLSNRHPVNFVKSLYPRNKIKGGEILWQKQNE